MSSLGILDYTADLHAIAELVARPNATSDVLERALHSLQQVVPYDLATVFRLSGDVGRVIAAAGPLVTPTVRRHELDLRGYPTLRRALETRRPIALAEHHHASEEGDPFDGVIDLPHGHFCMVVPLFAGDHSLGLITIDRQTCGRYPPSVVEIAGVYGQLVSLALLFADQAALLDRNRHQLQEHNRLLAEEAGSPQEAVRKLEACASRSMRELARVARQVAASDLSVLVTGETGTGKEVVAQAIHAWSPRAERPFVKLNCSAIPENLVESELFGHVKGAFSSAHQARHGRFLTANGGTLLLDEIGDMPLSAQAKLLRVLQEGAFEPVGSDRTVSVDVRVVAATNANLEERVAAGRFREDLYYRLAVFPLVAPPLRDRPEDVPGIVQRFFETEHARSHRGPWTLADEALQALQAAKWPGNVRELRNALERATILQPRGAIGVEHLGLGDRPAAAPSAASAPGRTFRENERGYLEALLARAGGKLYGADGAAALAGLKPTTLRSKLVKHGIR